MNGGQIFYTSQFGIGGKDSRSTWLTGLTNSAPYLCCALIGCWMTVPFNHWFGRRGTIFITCAFSAIACFWQGFVNTWWHMFIARFALGLGIGPKSATVPIYAAETTPPAIRGALVMQWQMWTGKSSQLHPPAQAVQLRHSGIFLLMLQIQPSESWSVMLRI